MKNQLQNVLNENEKLAQLVQQQNKEIENLKNISNTVQVNLSELKEIISNLRQNDPNSVVLTSLSDCDSDYGKENVLNPDDKFWCSNNVENSWIQFHFTKNRISPSKYLIRNHSNWYYHSTQSWKLEGSNNESNWELIDNVTNCEIFKQNNQEKTFSCQTEKFFSFLRFTQTQENLFRFHNPSFSFELC
jgi:hypothetical protein